MATPQTTEKKFHPIVTLDYRVRVIAMLVMGVIPLFHYEGRPPLPALAAMAFTGVVWPHVAYFLARCATDSRAAEFRNLLLDSLFVGVLTAAHGSRSGACSRWRSGWSPSDGRSAFPCSSSPACPRTSSAWPAS